MTTRRNLARTAILPLSIALGAIGAYQYVARRSLPKASGGIARRGLDGRLEVIRDKWGVPHIYASTANDAFFAQGYVHAQDRLWQMEFQRRIGSGRLAEVFGKRALEADLLIRRVGINRVAQAEAEALTGESREAVEAYAAGVNAYLGDAGRKLPVEYILVRFSPEPWKIADGLSWAKVMAWGLSTNWEAELLRARLVALVGVEEAARLDPPYPSGQPVVVPAGLDYAGVGGRLLESYQQIKELLQISSEVVGSNNWVVDGKKSITGKPLLANDPHLLPIAPSTWYEIHLCAPGLNVIGASLPGAPGVIIGHNERIAWGITNSMADVQDLYVERRSSTDPCLFEFQGAWERAQVVREEIKVRGQPQPVAESVTITRHGPIITPLCPAELGPLALRWVGLEPGSSMNSVLKLNRAANWAEFTEALSHWVTPSQNFVYADVDGNIGYCLSGRIPIRAKGNGMVPVPGWTGEYEWVGSIPHEALPHVFNPTCHFIATANNKVVSEDYPHFISADWHNGYRASRIAALIENRDKLSVDDFRHMQGDLYSLPCAKIAEHLLTLAPRDHWQEEALRHVAAWDGRLTPGTVGGAVCHVFLWRLQAKVFGQKLPGLLDEFLGAGIHPTSPTNSFFGRSIPLLLELLDEGDDSWFGRLGDSEIRANPTVTWRGLIEESFAEAVAYLRKRLGDRAAHWHWGRLHRVTFSHIFANVPPLHLVFNRGPYPIGGDADTVCQSGYLPHAPFEARAIASYRQIVDLGDFRNSRMIHAPGQSGNPTSRHYDDLVRAWREVEYHPMLFDRQDVLANARSIQFFEGHD